LIEKDGQVGVLQQPSGGGAISFEGVEGIEVPKDSKSSKAAIDVAKAMTDNEMKSLKAVLTPFAKPGKELFDFATGELTNDGKSAIDGALDLINKQKEGKALTATEQKKVRHAYRAWEIYSQISDRVSAPYYGAEGDNESSWRAWQ
jgi:hypothetical protein